jgi:ketosteroid isomerase-like protein
MSQLSMIFWLFSIFSISIPCASVPAAISPGTHENNPSIVEASDAYLKAVLACDLPAISGMFDDDASLMPPNQALLHGKRDTERFYAGLCHGPAKLRAFTFNHIEAKVAGDVAYDVGAYKMVLAVGPEQTVEDNGKYSVILKRVDDAWKIAYLIFNTDLPPQPLGSKAKK